MNLQDIEPSKSGLVFFDMLNVYYHTADHEANEGKKRVLRNAVRLRDAARKAGIPIFYTQANHRPDGATNNPSATDTDLRLRPWPGGTFSGKTPAAMAGSWEQEIVAELKPRAEDYMIPKFRWSAFHETYLDLALRVRGIDTIILSGGAIDIGIASTAYSARDRDYNLVIVSDACSGSHIDTGNVMIDKIFPRLARVRTTDQVLEMLKTRTP